MGSWYKHIRLLQTKIDRAVIKGIKNGNTSTLNSIDELNLAEKLVELHPWADMAKFTRSGGEANAVAIRIARACSGKRQCCSLWLSRMA